MQPGAYFHQFLVDGRWHTSANGAIQPDEQGKLCNHVSCACTLQFPAFMTSQYLHTARPIFMQLSWQTWALCEGVNLLHIALDSCVILES